MFEMMADFKGTPKAGGTYRIVNITNGKVYYGSAARFVKRFKDHIRELERGKHGNPHLQHSFTLNGSNSFLFEVLEVVDTGRQDRLAAEQLLLDTHFDGGKECFNIKSSATSTEGRKSTEETRRRQSAARIGRFRGVDHPMFGKHHTEEAKRLSGLVHVGKPSPNKGKKASAETRAKISASHKGKPAHNKGTKSSMATRERVRKARAKQIMTPKTYDCILLSPTGETYTHIVGLVAFCKTHGLTPSGLSSLLSGRYPSYKGWHLLGVSSPVNVYDGFQLVAPDGTIYTRIEGLAAFAKEHGLSKQGLYRIIKGSRPSYKGWRLLPFTPASTGPNAPIPAHVKDQP